MLAKANSRATVHRPAYLDYVGVKTFDENGEVDGERRFLGLFVERGLHRVADADPADPREGHGGAQAQRLRPAQPRRQGLMDTLETYPRDELFHTPVDELAPMAEAVMSARERRQVRMFIRRDTYGRYVSVLVYLPRDRYNTGVRERFARILQERSTASPSSSPSGSTSRRPPGCTSSSTCPARRPRSPTSTPPTSSAGSPRRPAPGATTSHAAVIAEYGEEVGTLLGRRYADSFPEAYKEDFSAGTAAVDLGRLEAIADRRAGLDLSLYEQLDAGPARRG